MNLQEFYEFAHVPHARLLELGHLQEDGDPAWLKT